MQVYIYRNPFVDENLSVNMIQHIVHRRKLKTN